MAPSSRAAEWEPSVQNPVKSGDRVQKRKAKTLAKKERKEIIYAKQFNHQMRADWFSTRKQARQWLDHKLKIKAYPSILLDSTTKFCELSKLPDHYELNKALKSDKTDLFVRRLYRGFFAEREQAAYEQGKDEWDTLQMWWISVEKALGRGKKGRKAREVEEEPETTGGDLKEGVALPIRSKVKEQDD